MGQVFQGLAMEFDKYLFTMQILSKNYKNLVYYNAILIRIKNFIDFFKSFTLLLFI